LLEFLDKHISRSTRDDPSLSEHMKEFRKNLSMDLLELDLASVKSTFTFCGQVIKKYVMSHYNGLINWIL
jgi:hypothetical protein